MSCLLCFFEGARIPPPPGSRETSAEQDSNSLESPSLLHKSEFLPDGHRRVVRSALSTPKYCMYSKVSTSYGHPERSQPQSYNHLQPPRLITWKRCTILRRCHRGGRICGCITTFPAYRDIVKTDTAKTGSPTPLTPPTPSSSILLQRHRFFVLQFLDRAPSGDPCRRKVNKKREPFFLHQPGYPVVLLLCVQRLSLLLKIFLFLCSCVLELWVSYGFGALDTSTDGSRRSWFEIEGPTRGIPSSGCRFCFW